MAGTPGACSQVFCHSIRCIRCVAWINTSHIHKVRTTTTTTTTTTTLRSHFGSSHFGSSAFTSLGLHSDCSVAAMISPRLSAGLWLPSIGAGNAFGKSAKFEDLRVPEVLVALVGGPSSKDDTVSPPPSPHFELKMLTFGFGAVSGTSLSIFFKMECLAATLVAILKEAHCDFVAGKCAMRAMMGW